DQPLSPGLEALVRHAAWIGRRGDEPTVSFTSLFLALLHGRDPWSLWAQLTAKRTGTTLDRVLQRWKVSGGQPPDFTRDRLMQSGDVPVDRFGMTRSASALTVEARTVADLIGAYIYGTGHEDDLAASGFNRERWAVLFFPRLERESREAASR